MYFTTDSAAKPGLPFYKTVLCLLCVLILVVNGISLARNLQSLRSANELQAQGARVGDKVQYLNVLIMDAESSLQGHFLSGAESYLGPLRTARAEINTQFAELQKLLADSPSQLKNLAQLRTLIYRKLSSMDQTLTVYRSGGLDDVVRIAETAESQSVMDEIRLQVVIIAREQTELMTARSAAFYKQYQSAVVLGIGINLAAILVIALFYRLIRSSFFSRLVAQRALQHANDTLESMVVLRTEQLAVLSRHLISVSEEEKAKLARELHDEMGANLTAISIDINAVTERLRPDHAPLAAMLERARATLVDTVQLKRRIVENLRPSLLDNLGLAAALHSYCDEFGKVTGIDCEALIDGDVDAAGPMHAIAVFRIVQEALNNVAKYARARHVIVHLAREGDDLALEVIDDGIGIELDAAREPKSHGLLGMRERALLLGGSLKIKRGINGIGTCVEALIPLVQQGAAQDAVSVTISAPHPPAGDHIPSLQPCSTRPHTPQDLDGQLR
ncbi:histidine kinase [Massilia eurypsychrophila]|uniref:Histidine kinase n=1 Tax=Massilia eurypsychrophila TaxID=1485217 RepID=A0A2G8TIG2_9BURK|nr:CHASE3 domain-containing protein [Massilia eurypsychrophila]PIL45834.1 histidine kinase [Massilia eurypsychrophila]